MTTAGVVAFKPARVDALWMSSYNYPYHAFKQKQLCDYYECYKSKPVPQFRRTSADLMRQEAQCCSDVQETYSGKKQKDVFAEPICWNLPGTLPATPAKPRTDFLVRPRISGKEYSRWRFETTPVVTTQVRAEWNNFLNRCPERFDIQLPLTVPGNECREPYFDGGYALKYLRPHLTRRPTLGSGYIEKLVGEIQRPATDSPFRDIRVISPFATYG